MKAKIVTTIVGCFGVSEDNRIIGYVEFPKDPESIAELMEQSKSTFLPQEKKIESLLKEHGFDESSKSESEYVTSNLRKLAIEKGFFKTPSEFNQLVSKVNIALAKKEIKKAITRDHLIMQANNAIEELDKSINILIERLREWYGLHFPEMNNAIADHKKFAMAIEEFGSRENMQSDRLSYYKEKSMGADFKKADIKIVQELSSQLLSLYKTRDDIAEYMDALLKEIAPNLKDVAGPVLSSKLIALAGGLDKLARMPSSTIQLLGAEKALFRHLHGQGKSPKHGIIVMHPYIKNAALESRGKIARLMAAKISIAAKMDFYSKEYKGGELKKDLEAKIKETLKAGR